MEIMLEVMLGKKALAKIQIKIGKQKLGAPNTISIPMFEIGIDKDLTLEIFATSEGYKKTKILSKRIFKGEMPAA